MYSSWKNSSRSRGDVFSHIVIMQREEILLALDLLLCQNRSRPSCQRISRMFLFREFTFRIVYHFLARDTFVYVNYVISRTILGLFRIEEDVGTGILLKSGECFLLQRSLNYFFFSTSLSLFLSLSLFSLFLSLYFSRLNELFNQFKAYCTLCCTKEKQWTFFFLLAISDLRNFSLNTATGIHILFLIFKTILSTILKYYKPIKKAVLTS